MKKQQIKSALIGLGKLSAAGCTIALIAMAFLTMNPDPEQPVKQAEADIFELGMGPADKQDLFVQSLKDLDMEKPRPYDWNGNKFYFSMKQTKQSPLEVMREFQQKFAENGVNSRAYLTEVPTLDKATPVLELKDASKEQRAKSAEIYKQNLERLDDFFNGGVIPVHASEDYIAMSGSTPKIKSENSLEYLKNMAEARQTLGESVRAMRFIDARRNRQTGLTTVTATWSDRDLDVKKLTNRSDTMSLNVDPDIPACMGCTRLMRFAGEDKEEAYVDHVFAGSGSVQQIMAFYDHALKSRGWMPGDSSYALEKFMNKGLPTTQNTNARVRYYARGNTFLTVLAYPDSTKPRTIVHLLESP